MTLMMFIVGVALLLLLLAAGRWYAAAAPQNIVAGLRWAAVLGGGAFAIFLVATGRAMHLVYLVIPFLPFLRRWWRGLGGAAAGSSNRSEVETPWLRMALDHGAGTMDGLVLQGAFAGRRLAELTAPQLLELLGVLRISHPESALLLETYLDAVHPGWREAEATAEPPREPPRDEMSRAEALRILGLAEGASESEIRDAWREAMKRNHPDQGGSAYLAAQINRAKERLLGT